MSFLDTISNTWTNEELTELERHQDKTLDFLVDLFKHKEFNRSRDAIRRKRNKLLKNKFISVAKENSKELEKIEIKEEDHLESVFSQYDKDIEKKALLESKSENGKGNIYKSKNNNQKYLVISDLHIPFHLDKVLEIINEYGNKDYSVIIAGDALDCHDISVYPKSKNVGLANEVNMFKDILKLCSKLYNDVYIISGNHSRRHSSYLRKRISSEVVAFIQDDILENIVTSLKLQNIHYTSGDTLNWYIQIDNVILAHPDTYKKSILGTVQDTYNYFDARNTSANIFMIGHTHALGMCMYKNRTLVEIGCMCQPQEYSMSGNLAYTPQSNGYCIFESINGKVTFNNIKLVSI